MTDLIVAAYDRTDTQGVADSVVKYLRRDHGYEVLVVGPGHARNFEALTSTQLEQTRFFLELDAVSGVLHHTHGLERLSCPKLAWFVDTHKKPQHHQRIAADFDLVLYAMRAWAGLFGDRGRWLPVHADAEWFKPREGVEPTFDVGFVGSQPHERTRALKTIAERHGLSLLLETTTGPREKERTAELYARCRIVFNQHVANDLNFRVVEALACHRLLLTDAQRNGQYELFQDREHLAYYKDDADLEALLLRYLHEPAERERIASAGHALVHREHTTAARVRAIVAAAEELVRARGGPARSAGAEPRGDGSRRLLVLEPDAASRADWLSELGREARIDVVTLAAPPRPIPGVCVHVADAPEPLGPARADWLRSLVDGLPLLETAHDLVARSLEPEAVVAGADLVGAAELLGRPVLEPHQALPHVRRGATLGPPEPPPSRTARQGRQGSAPDVSVLLVSCDRPELLVRTLRSTRAALERSPRSVEWLAFDNGSGARARRVLDEAGLDLVLRSGRNRGLAPALDALHAEARGRYLLTLEEDWECLRDDPGWLDLAITILDTQPDVGVVRLRRLHDRQTAHASRHRPDVALRHHPWSFDPLPDVVETRHLGGEPYYVAAAAWANWTHNPTLCRREVRDWIGPLSAYLPDPRDHRPSQVHPGLEGAIDLRWCSGPWKSAKLAAGPFTHTGDVCARVAVGAP